MNGSRMEKHCRICGDRALGNMIYHIIIIHLYNHFAKNSKSLLYQLLDLSAVVIYFNNNIQNIHITNTQFLKHSTLMVFRVNHVKHFSDEM